METSSTTSGAATGYFTGLASLYADYRPTYPIEAIDFILDGLNKPIIAADVGCGTGISTRLLASRGAQVVGIDPNADMLDQAKRTASPDSNRIQYRTGTSESTGLQSASVDLVVCAQAFHWFDPPRALAEFHRIMRAGGVGGVGGRLALMWNVQDDRDPFTAIYYAVTQRAQKDAATRGLIVRSEREADPTAGGYFGSIRTREFSHQQSLNLDGLLGRIRSASYFPKQGPLLQELERELSQAFDRFKKNGIVELVYRTEVTLLDRKRSWRMG